MQKDSAGPGRSHPAQGRVNTTQEAERLLFWGVERTAAESGFQTPLRALALSAAVLRPYRRLAQVCEASLSRCDTLIRDPLPARRW